MPRPRDRCPRQRDVSAQPSVCGARADDLSLYLEHRSRLIEYASTITGSHHNAEDVVQESFLRFAMDRTADVEQPLAYLYRIIRNQSVDLLRRTRAEAKTLQDDAMRLAPCPEPTPEQQALHANELASVYRALASLPDSTRIAIEMHRVGGEKLEDVAAYLGVSVATVHRMVRRALTKIAEDLA